MEEIVTVNGMQYKLMADRPLTAMERQQTIDQIKSQTGCSSCHSPGTLSRGGVYSLPFGNDGSGTNSTVAPIGSGSTVTLTATPLGGVGPYDVRFWRSNDGTAPTQTGIVSATYPASAEGLAVAGTYTISDADVAAAVGNAGALAPSDVNTATGAITLGGAAAALAASSIRFYTSIVDSCQGSGGRGTCAQYVDVAMVCVAPTCNFVVS